MKGDKGLKCVCLNARSIINKLDELTRMVDEIQPDIIGITESWANKNINDAELGLEGYAMYRKDRNERIGGGVLLYIKDTIQVIAEEKDSGVEAVWCKLIIGKSKVTIGVIYRSPNTTKEDDEKLHTNIRVVSGENCIIMGDFNHGHIDWQNGMSVGDRDREFHNVVQDCFLTQHVVEPTRGDNILDLILSTQKEIVDNVVIEEPLGNSDHNQITFQLNVFVSKKKQKQMHRNFNKANYRAMAEYMEEKDWGTLMHNKNTSECWDILKNELNYVVEKYVPMQKGNTWNKKKNLSKEAMVTIQ